MKALQTDEDTNTGTMRVTCSATMALVSEYQTITRQSGNVSSRSLAQSRSPKNNGKRHESPESHMQCLYGPTFFSKTALK